MKSSASNFVLVLLSRWTFTCRHFCCKQPGVEGKKLYTIFYSYVGSSQKWTLPTKYQRYQIRYTFNDWAQKRALNNTKGSLKYVNKQQIRIFGFGINNPSIYS